MEGHVSPGGTEWAVRQEVRHAPGLAPCGAAERTRSRRSGAGAAPGPSVVVLPARLRMFAPTHLDA
ncbi:hypothetical protein ACPCUV_23260 [Streptomyces platensis]|uniref:hypothetical protein n=1 Tax=Streptomyces platensis TaxID=58346 RepID=UPI003C2CCE5F